MATPCGFDPRHRHHPESLDFTGLSGLFYADSGNPISIFRSSDLQIDLALLFREETHDRLRGRHLGIEVKMRVNVARRGNVAVTEPLLNILQRHAVGIKQGRTGMTQIVEADAAHTVVFEKLRERLCQMSGLDPLAQIVDVDIIPVIVAIALAAKISVLFLFCFYPQEQFLKGRHDRQTAEPLYFSIGT